jgi:hypothetical protein
MTDLLIAIFAFLTAAIGIVWKARVEIQKHKAKAQSAIRERDEFGKIHSSGSFYIDFKDLNRIKIIVDDIMRHNQIDSFLMLSSVNGKDPVNYVSVLYEQHEATDSCRLSFGATSKYMDIRTDTAYKESIQHIKTVGPLIFDVFDDMPEGMLRKIYVEEKVCHAMLIFTATIPISKDADRLMFCSWLSHEENPIREVLKLKIESANAQIKQLLTE